jgi:hypothetical protein
MRFGGTILLSRWQGAFTGKIWGTLGKLACGAVIVALVTVDALF